MVLIGVMYFGQALYAHFKKQANQAASRPSPRPRMRQTVQQPVTKQKPDSYDKKGIKQQPFLAGENIINERIGNPLPTIDEMAENIQTSPPGTVIDDSTSPITSQTYADNLRDELKRAVIWSEILKRKY